MVFFLKELLFGTAGIPLSTKNRSTENGIARVKELKLNAMELEFVRSVNISEEKAPLVKKAAEKNKIVLTCHAPYFINLNAKEKQKVGASKHRILESARRLHQCGGWSVCFHPGFYLGETSEKVFPVFEKRIKELRERLNDESIDLWLRPETTGKPSQFGSLKELLKISQGLEKVAPVVDFSHLHARSGGKENTKEEFLEQFNLIEKFLGKKGLQNMHIHLSGINYTEKGERNHLILEESDMNYKDLLKIWKEFKIKGIVICESPNIEEDALLLQKFFKNLK